MPLGHIGERYANRLTICIVKDEHFSVFANIKAGENLAGFGFDGDHSEGDVHVATWVQRVFEQTVETTITDSVETGAERLTYIANLVAVRTNAFRKDGAACFWIVRFF